MKKAVVFGGSGFVGSHVADALTAAGVLTTVVDVQPSEYISQNQEFVQGDILDAGFVQEMVKEKDLIYHLAGQADIGIGFERPKETVMLNIEGTVNILEACRQHRTERFIFASTIYVYSDMGGFYRASKQACELLIEEYQKKFNVDYTILRYGSLYGPRADERNLIHRILKQAILHKSIKIGYGMDEKRDFIHVQDAARMSVDILSDVYKNSHVMLTGHESVSRGDLIHIINEMLGGKLDIELLSPEIDRAHGHYRFTPYVFKPKISKKILADSYTEFGQGILNCMEEIYEKYVAETC
jgi:UDP-glucose 4-epimerase